MTRAGWVRRQAVALLFGDRAQRRVLLLGALMATVLAVALCGAFAAAGAWPRASGGSWVYWALLIAVVVVADAVASTLSVVLAAMAQARFDGAPMTARGALAYAVRRRSALLGLVPLSYAGALGGTVVATRFGGTRAASSRHVASWFAVPVMAAAEDVGPREATRRSAALFDARWDRWDRPKPRVPEVVDLPALAGLALLAVGAQGASAAMAVAGAVLIAVAIVLRRAVRELFALLIYRAQSGTPAPGLAPEQLDALVQHRPARRPAGVGRFDDAR